ncbi:hypothetical protein NQ317_000638 [Molorchus minor]|uniref:Inorganic phosphate cotransporter n=1 Tax=Molorchus minor TaxID=1323400 RepID=A0ABQ9JIS0_9CUCU|nr:hypothetical protein NQ317_000638 [Molorchus minor]
MVDTCCNREVKKKKFKVPWLKLVRSSVIWALFVAQWSHNYIYFTLFLELPKYMKEVLHLSVESNAAFSFMPFFCLWISSIIFAFLADVLTNKGWLSVLNCRRIYTTVGNVVPAVCIMLACFFKCNRTAAIGLYAVGILMIGPFFSGMKVNINDVSRYYAGTIMAWVNGIGATAGVLGPWVVGYIVKDVSI